MLLLSVLFVPSISHADVVFVYDKLGRLVRAIRPDGEAATWHYDAVGNVLQITRESGMPQTPTVSDVSPSGGGRGSTITITITGVNLLCGAVEGGPGITVTAVDASLDQLTVTLTIAADAVLGTTSLTIRCPDFTTSVEFGITAGIPSITGAAPPRGAAGTLVVIEGIQFDERGPSFNQVAFNGVPAVVEDATSSTLSVRVPSGATTGPISLTTPGGTATSPFDFVAGSITVASVTPGTAERGQTLTLTFAGTNLLDTVATAPWLSAGNQIATSTTLTTDVTVSFDAPRSGVISVTNQLSSGLVSFTTTLPPPIIDVFSPTIGAVGSVVTLLGSGFDELAAGNNVVTFNGATAEVVSVTPTQLRVTVPAAATNGPISITTARGTFTTAGSFTPAAASLPVVATVEAPFFTAASATLPPDGTRVYVTETERNRISVIDTAAHAVAATIPVGLDPMNAVVSPDGGRLYVLHFDARLSVVDLATRMVLTTVQLAGSAGDLAVSRDGATVFASHPEGLVSVIDAASGTLAATLTVGNDPERLVVSPTGNRVHVINAGEDTVSIIDSTSRTVIATVAMPVGGTLGVFSPDGTLYYQAGPSDVGVLDTASNTVISTVPGVGNARAMVLHPAGTRLYVAASGVVVIDTATSSILTTIPGVGRPLAITPDGAHLIGRSNEDAAYLRVAIVDTSTSAVTTTVLLPGEDAGGLVAVSNDIVYAYGAESLNMPVLDVTAAAPVDAPIARTGVGRVMALATSGLVRGYGRSGGLRGLIASFDPSTFQAQPNTLITGQPDDLLVAGVRFLAVDPAAGARLYTDSHPNLLLIDAATRSVVASAPIPVINAIVPSPDGTRVYTVNNIGRVNAVDGATGASLGSLNLGAAASTSVITPDGGKLYVRSTSAGRLFVVGTTEPSLLAAIPLTAPATPVITTSGDKVLIVDTAGIRVIDTSTDTIVATLTPGGSPGSLAVSPTAAQAFATDFANSRIVRIDTAANALAGEFSLPAPASALTVSADGSRLYVVLSGQPVVITLDTSTGSILGALSLDVGCCGSVGRPVNGPNGRVFIPIENGGTAGRAISVVVVE